VPAWLDNAIGVSYKRIPLPLRPVAKRAFMWGEIRLRALISRRKVFQGHRVVFVGSEIATLERYEFLGPGPREVLIDAEFSAVSPGTERAVLCGLPGSRRSFPYAPGYSVAGRVVSVGAGVDGIKIGDRVAGRMSHATAGTMGPASMFKVPAGVEPREACFIELGIITLQGIRKARIRPGERVAVIGQGLIGQLAVRLARAVGATPVIAVAASRRRMRSALMPGAADEFVASREAPDAVARLEADVVIEAVGNASGIVQAMSAARRGGRVVLLGSSRELGRDLDWHAVSQERALTLVGAHISALPATDASAGRWTYDQEGRLFLDLLAAGRLRVADLITWTTAPSECNRIYETLAEGGREHVGIVFDWRTRQTVD